MILIDDILEVKEETPEVLRAPAVDAIQPPPPYDQSEPLLPIASRYGTFSRFPRVLSTRRRFLKAFFVAWAVWILVYCLVISWKDLLKPGSVPNSDGRSHSRPRKPAVKIPIDDSRIRTPSCVNAIPVSSDLRASEAIIFMNDEKPNQAAVNFSVPADSDLVYFFNNGSANRGFGFIRISVSEERRPDIQVDVTISYRDADALNTTKICLVEENIGETGVGIVFPTSDLTRETEAEQVRFDFDVILPAPLDESESELFIKRLKTNFTVVHHRLDDFLKKVKFGSVSLQTSFMPISISGLSADDVEVRSQDSLFVGIIHATKSVDLRTSNSPISIDVSITNNDTQHPGEVILKTSNSPIDASLRLFSENSKVGGAFLVDARTENAHIGLYNYDLPNRSSLVMKARTSRAPVTILAPPEFEGSFQFTSELSPSFVEPRHVEDPEARGRRRSVKVTSNLGPDAFAVEGKVWWNEEHGELSEPQMNSTIVVETTVNPIFFKLYHVEG